MEREIFNFRESQISKEVWDFLHTVTYNYMGDRACSAFEGVVPADAPLKNFGELLSYFREFPCDSKYFYEIKHLGFQNHKFYGLDTADDWGDGGIWAIYSPNDLHHVSWLITTTNHWCVLSPRGKLIERDARNRVSRWWGEPAVATLRQRKMLADIIAGKVPIEQTV